MKGLTNDQLKWCEQVLGKKIKQAGELTDLGNYTVEALKAQENLKAQFFPEEDARDDEVVKYLINEEQHQKKRVYGHPKFRPLLDEIAELHDIKNRQYASAEEPLGNFVRGGNMCKAVFREDIRNDPYKLQMAYALVLVTKQIDGAFEILAYNKENTPDSLKEKLRDVITYFAILDCINQDRLEYEAGVQSKNIKSMSGEVGGEIRIERRDEPLTGQEKLYYQNPVVDRGERDIGERRRNADDD